MTRKSAPCIATSQSANDIAGGDLAAPSARWVTVSTLSGASSSRKWRGRKADLHEVVSDMGPALRLVGPEFGEDAAQNAGRHEAPAGRG